MTSVKVVPLFLSERNGWGEKPHLRNKTRLAMYSIHTLVSELVLIQSVPNNVNYIRRGVI